MYIQEEENKPWLDIRITEDMMEHLWNIIDSPTSKEMHKEGSSKQKWLQDKDNLFFDTVLKELIKQLYYSEWNNYYEIVITKTKPDPIFTLSELWVNYQKQYDFNPPHNHQGVFSFVIFMKIPTHCKEQYALPNSLHGFRPSASDFQFIWSDVIPNVRTTNISLNPEDEGRMLFFPSWLKHQVFPFYGTEEERITISGNLIKI